MAITERKELMIFSLLYSYRPARGIEAAGHNVFHLNIFLLVFTLLMETAKSTAGGTQKTIDNEYLFQSSRNRRL